MRTLATNCEAPANTPRKKRALVSKLRPQVPPPCQSCLPCPLTQNTTQKRGALHHSVNAGRQLKLPRRLALKAHVSRRQEKKGRDEQPEHHRTTTTAGKGEMNLQRSAVLFGLHVRVYLLAARSDTLEYRSSNVDVRAEALKCRPLGRDDMNLQR